METSSLYKEFKRQKMDIGCSSNDMKMQTSSLDREFKQHKMDIGCSSNDMKMQTSSLNREFKHQKMDIGCSINAGLEDLTNKLTHDCLLKLFAFLPRNDIITMQRVCHDWRISAQDKSLWNKYTLTLTGFSEDIKKIIIMPAVRIIDGKAGNHMLDVILNNVTGLKKLNCDFKPGISSPQTKKVLEKYPELESITVNVCSSDIVECINVLKTASHIKEVVFGDNWESCYELVSHQSSSVKIFETLADSQNFPALTNLNLTNFCSRDLEDTKILTLLADVIRKRSQQLLYIQYDGNITVPILNSISICTKLKRLDMSIFDDHPISFNLDDMTQLESLCIYSGIDCNDNCPKLIQDIVTSCCWVHLTEVDLNFNCLRKMNILRMIIENAKQLRILKYRESRIRGYTITENQLENIGSLLTLQELTVAYFETMTQKSLDYLSSCENLTYLNFIVDHPNIKNILFRIAKMISCLTKLTAMRIYIGVKIHLHNRDEIDGFIECHLHA